MGAEDEPTPVAATPADPAPTPDPAPPAETAPPANPPAPPAGMTEADFDRLYEARRARERADEEARTKAPAPKPKPPAETKPDDKPDTPPGGAGGPGYGNRRWFKRG